MIREHLQHRVLLDSNDKFFDINIDSPRLLLFVSHVLEVFEL